MTLVVAVLLSSCTVSLTCELYNNTDTPIQIIQRDKNGQEKHFALMPKESANLSDWGYHVYEVKTENISWSYDPPMASYIPSSEYIETTGFGPFFKRLIRAQLNEDGKIFLIKIGEKPPISENFEQPEGYPLVPNTTTTPNT
jgi:hypothetical protein